MKTNKAEEYFKTELGFKPKEVYKVSCPIVIELMESYHQSRSQEEAQERYEKALKFVRSKICYYNAMDKRTKNGKTWDMTLRIAAGLDTKTEKG